MIESAKKWLLLAPVCSAASLVYQKSCRTLITDCELTRSPTTSYAKTYTPCYTTSVSTSTSTVQSTIVSTSTAIDPVSTVLSTDSTGLTVTVTAAPTTISSTFTVPVTTVSVMLTWQHVERIVTKLPPAGFEPIKETIEKGECLDAVVRKNKDEEKNGKEKDVVSAAIEIVKYITGHTAGKATETAKDGHLVQRNHCPNCNEEPIYPGDVKCTAYFPSPTCVTQGVVVTATAPKFPLIATTVTTSTATRTLVPEATTWTTVTPRTTTTIYVTSLYSSVATSAITTTAVITIPAACGSKNYLKEINGYGIIGAELAHDSVKDVADAFFAKSQEECCFGALEQLGGSAFQYSEENKACYPYYKKDGYDPKAQLGSLIYDPECRYGYTWGNGYRGQWDQYQCYDA